MPTVRTLPTPTQPGAGDPLERPQLRRFVAATQDEQDPDAVLLHDRLGLADRPQRVSLAEFLWLQLFDGQRTLRDIQAEAIRQAGGTLLPLEWFAALARRLDDALLLDGPRFRQRVAGPVRAPSCLGCYETDPAALRRQLRGYFTCPLGPGLPRQTRPDGRLRAALIPHIDYYRGGPAFAWGFKEVAERTDSALFVIVGTSHYSGHRFTLTRKDFRTPLGTVSTDQRSVDRLVQYYGEGLFDDELCHLPEHSIELEVVFLQYLFEGRRPFRIVPLLAGPFQDCVETGSVPRFREDIARMIEALRRLEAEAGEPICYLISGDLAHIGPKFGDPDRLSAPVLAHSRRQDHALLAQAVAADPDGYFRIVADEDDRRRVCGLPPTYPVLEAIRPGHGKLLHYDQYVHPRGFESVSFASVGFYR
jgi:AmmeMemoRadiSam system protein B